MGDEHVVFFERSLIQQQLQALPRGEPAAGVLALDPGFATAEARLVASMIELFEDVSHLTPPLFPIGHTVSSEDAQGQVSGPVAISPGLSLM